MSKFFSEKYNSLTPYVPGEQPKDMKYIKLNTNESPFPPTEKILDSVNEEVKKFQLYPDPDCTELISTLAENYGVDKENVIVTNGSDEILNFAFMAYCDKNTPAAFADITYGFYPVFAEVNNLPYREIPLLDDLSININDYKNINSTIFIANPNAPTGKALGLDAIEEIIVSNPNNIVVIDEAYVDFGAESAVPLTKKYNNLLVTQTFSKSRSMAGARLGFGIADASLIQDLNTIRYSTNPYNINRATMAAGIATLKHDYITKENCSTIVKNRECTITELKRLGFELTDSKTNFVFAKHKDIDGASLYEELKSRGILIRHFTKERIKDYNRITIGSLDDMKTLISTIELILEKN